MNLYKKIGSVLAVAGLSVLVAAPAFAAGTDVTFSSDTNILLTTPGVTITVANGSQVATYSIDPVNATFNMDVGSSVTIKSSGLLVLNNNKSLTTQCAPDGSYTFVTAPTVAVASPFVVFPTAAVMTCATTNTPAPGGSTGGGIAFVGGGGGGGSSSPATVAHSTGVNVKTPDGTVWMVLPGNCRSAYTSAGAFVSYGFNSWTGLVDANAADLALPVCANQYIPPQDGQIIIADRGVEMNTAYFISGGVKHGFVSHAVYLGQGFPESRLTGAKAVRADISWMTKGSNIESATAAHFAGTLINKDGTILLVGSSSLLGIPDPATFYTWGYSFDNTVMANAADRLVPMSGVMVTRGAGQLSPQ